MGRFLSHQQGRLWVVSGQPFRATGLPGVRWDLRLLPAVTATWAAAWVGIALVPAVSLPVGLSIALAAVACGVLASQRGLHQAVHLGGILLVATLALVCAAGAIISGSVQQQAHTAGPIGPAIASGQDVRATMTVRSSPQRASGFGTGDRYLVQATLTEAATAGVTFPAATPVLILAGKGWASVRPGQEVGAAGKLQASAAGSRVAALFLARTDPFDSPAIRSGKGGPDATEPGWRVRWRSAVLGLPPDAAGLLPGMVTGDRSGLPPDLTAAMKTAGLTHLTAVSGANCTMVLVALTYLARCCRTPRWLAAGLAAGGLAGFVGIVGPDPSVLRAAVMGWLGVFGMVAGRPRRTLCLLGGTVLVLLEQDPWLSADAAFVLSVLATIGLVLVARPCSDWLCSWLPLWLAQSLAVPLAAQLLCAPVIVLLQPYVAPYALPANMVVSPVIGLVTIVGTFGLACALTVPWLVPMAAAVAGIGASWVAIVARFFAGLPGASWPWPEGPPGAVLMAVVSALLLAGFWLVTSRHESPFLSGRGSSLGLASLRGKLESVMPSNPTPPR
ncbi:MAG: ComEC/Rec2 family competence protein [Micrococcaceae bacterium]|nr:ComEC/Rec2 family competence protein [Micrococcaceae bacterium]